jgi:hypothetical protein
MSASLLALEILLFHVSQILMCWNRAKEEEAFHTTVKEVLRDTLFELEDKSLAEAFVNLNPHREYSMLWHHGHWMMQRIEIFIKTYKELNKMLVMQAKVDTMGEGWEEVEIQTKRLIEIGRIAAREQVSRLAGIRSEGGIVEKDVQAGNAVLELGREGRPTVDRGEGLADALEKIAKNVRKGTKMMSEQL